MRRVALRSLNVVTKPLTTARSARVESIICAQTANFWPTLHTQHRKITSDIMAANQQASAGETAKELPPLSPADFRAYNRLAERMDVFHNHFRQTWNLMYQACENGRRPAGMTLKQFLNTGLSFAEHLTTHHTIEERYVFPMLAPRMPIFDPKRGDLVKQHEKIHHGLEDFEGYLQRCRSGDEEFEMRVLKGKMDGWGKVLWEHLDDEVRTLGAENMRKYYTKEEISRMDM